MNGDATYYAKREQEERRLASQAADDKAREIHLDLAEKYAELAAQEPAPERAAS